MWTKLSLNGYKTDFYFFIVTLLLNAKSFWMHSKTKSTRNKSLINLFLTTLQIIGICIFIWADTLQVDKVYFRDLTSGHLALFHAITDDY